MLIILQSNYLHACIHTYKCTYVRTYIHTYIHTYVHIYIYIYIYILYLSGMIMIRYRASARKWSTVHLVSLIFMPSEFMNVYVYFLLCISTLYDYNQSIWVVVTFIYHLTNHSITNFYPQLHAGDIQQDKDYMVHKPITECILLLNLNTAAVILSSRAQFKKKFGKSWATLIPEKLKRFDC